MYASECEQCEWNVSVLAESTKQRGRCLQSSVELLVTNVVEIGEHDQSTEKLINKYEQNCVTKCGETKQENSNLRHNLFSMFNLIC